MKWLFVAFTLIYGVSCIYPPSGVRQERSAIVIIQGANNVYGRINLTQHDEGPVYVSGHISGISPGKHGFHIHEKGDLTNGCTSTGGHFNPHHKQHGSPADSERHVGDLGNIQADNRGVARIEIQDSIISLTGENNVIGRAVVVHATEDDLGLTRHPDSKTTGNAGGRLGCGIIGVVYNSGMILKAPTIYQLVILATGLLLGKQLL